MEKRKSLIRSSVLTLVGILVLTSCGSGNGDSTGPMADPTAEESIAPKEIEKASLRLDWTFGTFHAPFLFALDNGYYKEEGIDLEITEGQGSGQTMTLVGTGEATFGWGDTGTAALQINGEVPIKVIAVVQRRTPFGIACHGDIVFTKPSDLVGHSVVMVPQESTAQMWPAYLKLNGISESDVKVVSADWSTKTALFLAGEADCMAGYPAVDILQAQLADPSIGKSIWWSDQGVHILSQGLVASEVTLAEKPELVRGFLRASLRAWKELCADPNIGSSFFIKRFPDLHTTDKEIAYSKQSMVHECSLTVPQEGTGATAFGATTDAEWKEMLDLLGEFGGLEPRQEATNYYTNSFLS